MDKYQLPIGALAFLGFQSRVLLVGEGTHLKAFEHETGELVSSMQVFKSQAIHGISCCDAEAADDADLPASIVIWGGRSVAVVGFAKNGQGGMQYASQMIISEHDVKDWVLDAIVRNALSTEKERSRPIVFAITAQNELKRLQTRKNPDLQNIVQHESLLVASGPRSTLYSAHMCLKDETRMIVAAGTVLGEIFVWSTPLAQSVGSNPGSTLHHRFTGHEGSIFGVRMALGPVADGTHLMASCSDDRSIRLWDISAAFRGDKISEAPQTCLGSTRGHISRIWSVRFWTQRHSLPQLLSFGEDGTTQRWQASQVDAADCRSTNAHGAIIALSHVESYEYHSGKHIWGMDLAVGQNGNCLIATGGGDGRVVSYELSTLKQNLFVTKMSVPTGLFSGESPSKTILDGMTGEWALFRSIKSRLSTSPSGSFEGTATITRRDPTDSAFDDECLYHESGTFKSDTGLNFGAKRQYVYRYQKNKDELTAWFVKADGESVDYLFHALLFEKDESLNVASENASPRAIGARGHHLCDKDTYDPAYTFQMASNALKSWQLKYTVRGPAKDYTSEAEFSRKDSTSQAIKDVGGSQSTQCKPNASSAAFVRAYVWISERAFLATTDSGDIFIATLNSRANEELPIFEQSDTLQQPTSAIEWTFIDRKEDLNTSSLVAGLKDHGVIVLTGKKGDVYFSDDTTRKVRTILEGRRKIGFLSILDVHRKEDTVSAVIFLRRLGASMPEIFHLRSLSEEAQPVTTLTHPSPASMDNEFVITSAYCDDKLSILVEGSRNGGLRIWHHQVPCQRTLEDVHSKDAVTAIVGLSSGGLDVHERLIMTAGRDGRLLTHLISIDIVIHSIQLETIHASTPLMGANIEGIHIHPHTKDLIVWGFTNTNFIVWNEINRQQILSFACGGAHRNWAYLPHENGGGGSFVCNKAGKCMTVYQPSASHSVLQHGGHGREIKSVAVMPSTRGQRQHEGHSLIATGAEDTTIRLSRLQDDSFKTLAVLPGHNAGVHGLHWSPSGQCLFSTAGIEELFAWRVRTINGQPYAMRKARCPQVTEDGALRVMDLAIIDVIKNGEAEVEFILQAVYSDSSTRSWRFSAGDAKFTLLSTAVYKINVLTQLQSLGGFKRLICTSSSDGALEFWDQDAAAPYATHAVHQSSIHSLLHVNLDDKELLLLTGGDDQAIGVTRVELAKTGADGLLPSTLLITNAHASAVTSIALAGSSQDGRSHRFVSVGTDQRLRVWIVRVDTAARGSQGVEVRKVRDIPIGVADASSLSAFEDGSNTWKIIVVGVGMEYRSLGTFA